MKKVIILSVIFLSTLTPNTLTAAPIKEMQNSKIKENKVSFYQGIAFKKATKKIKKKYNGEITYVKGCEKIKLRNGLELEVEIITMDAQRVSYKECNKENTKEMILSLQEIDKIYSESGDLLYKNLEPAIDEKYRNFSIAAKLLSILGFFPILGVPLSLMGIIFGLYAKKKLLTKPKQKKDYQRAATAVVLGFLGLITTTIFMFWLAANCCG